MGLSLLPSIFCGQENVPLLLQELLALQVLSPPRKYTWAPLPVPGGGEIECGGGHGGEPFGSRSGIGSVRLALAGGGEKR